MRPIHSHLHVILDYITILFLFISPLLFSMSPVVAAVTYLVVFIQLLLSVITNYPGGIFRIIPFVVHGYIEFMMSIGLFITAIYFWHRDLTLGEIFYFSLGTVYLIIFILTDFTFLVLPDNKTSNAKKIISREVL